MRNQFSRQAVISAKVVKGKEKEEAALKYRDYFDFSEPLKRCTSHRLLALRRGEADGILKVSITPADEEECTDRLKRQYVRGTGDCAAQVEEAICDAYKRLLKPAIETEFAALSKERPMKKPSVSLPKTSVSSCWQLLWDRSVSWESTRDSAPDARWSAWMHRERCCTTKPFIRIPQIGNRTGRPQAGQAGGTV